MASKLWPGLFSGRTNSFEYHLELFNYSISFPEGAPENQLSKDAADRPDIYFYGVLVGFKKQLGRPIPHRNHLFSQVI